MTGWKWGDRALATVGISLAMLVVAPAASAGWTWDDRAATAVVDDGAWGS